jgi:hypothetical protein
MICFSFGNLFDEPAVLEFDLFFSDNIKGLVSFANSRKEVFFFIMMNELWHGSFYLFDFVLESFDFNEMSLLVIETFLYFFKAHSLDKWKK